MNINANRTYLDIKENKNIKNNNKNIDYLNKNQISTNNYFFEEDNQKKYIDNFLIFLNKIKNFYHGIIILLLFRHILLYGTSYISTITAF